MRSTRRARRAPSRRTIVWLAMLLGVAPLVWVAYLDRSYASNMPRTSEPSAGRTIPLMVQRGTRVFVSEEEAARYESAQSGIYLGVFFCVVGAVVAATSGKGRYE